MSLASGTRVGPYLIEASLGAGGMGEVYRARDTRLDRTVAVKVLTGALAADSEFRQRLEQEARAIAALNDPHICTIHDVGRHGDLDYLVLEYLEGETLGDRLRRTPPLSTDEAIAIAIQIGDALDHAHRAGIVHRDLKPGNVMLVRRTGPASATHDAKLLDFGLAARTAAGRPRILDVALTETIAPAQEATQLAVAPVATGFSGTVQYMAPEQLQGEAGDQRADIFAFGCVLYEMLAGRKPFDGGNAMTVIAAITSIEPPPVAALQSTNPLLDHVLRRCLEKDRERRWQNIGDVTGELRWIATQPAQPPQPAMPGLRRSWTMWQWVTALAVLLVVLFAVVPVALIWGLRFLRGDRRADLPALRLELTTRPTDDPSLALSRDGTQLAFIANQDRDPMLWVRPLDGSSESRALPGTAGATFPFWSPDGQTIGFFADDKLKRIDVASGTSLVVADAPNARGGTWNGDGVILFGPGPNGAVVRVSARGGAAEGVTQPDATSGPAHHWPQFLPDGRQFLFTSRLGTPETNGVYLGSLDTTPPRRLLPGDSGGRFAAPDRLLTIRQGALQVYAFDPDAGAVEGEPALIAQGFGTASATGVFAASETGVLAYRVGAAQRRQLTWVDRKGTVLAALGEPETDFIAAPELSADEQSVLVVLQRTGDNDIWQIELARNLARRITDGPPADAHPLWDPDGQHAIFFSRRFGGGGPSRQAIAGGQAEPLLAKGQTGVPLSWTPDRQHVLIRRTAAKSGVDLVAVTVTGDPRDIAVANSPGDETEGQFSPDGKWVAFVSNESGRPEVFVQSFPDARGRVQVSTAGGAQVRWAKNGQEMFYVAPDGKMMSVSLAAAGAAVTVTAPVALFQTHLATGTNVLGIKPQYAVAKDGRFLLNTAIESASPPIVLSVNWMKRQGR
jgi:Tol biopolymer transport system component/tRNA A-37 threonylcarbamoyl transferase component Bud32